MKLTHVKLVTSNFDPKRPGAASLQGVTDFAEADGYELELRSDGLVSVTYGDEIALFSAGQLRHARAKRERAAPFRGASGEPISAEQFVAAFKMATEPGEPMSVGEIIAPLSQIQLLAAGEGYFGTTPTEQIIADLTEAESDEVHFDVGLSACGRCGLTWDGFGGPCPQCPPADPTLAAVITAVDKDAGVITYSGITPPAEQSREATVGKRKKKRR